MTAEVDPVGRGAAFHVLKHQVAGVERSEPPARTTCNRVAGVERSEPPARTTCKLPFSFGRGPR